VRLPHDALALVSCWRCSAHLLMDPATARALQQAGGTYCKTCDPIVKAEQAANPCLPGRRCRHVDYQRGPFADLVVTGVNGDQVAVHVLGASSNQRMADRFWPPVMRGRTVFNRGELIMKGL
jgi:hypothetical protein